MLSHPYSIPPGVVNYLKSQTTTPFINQGTVYTTPPQYSYTTSGDENKKLKILSPGVWYSLSNTWYLVRYCATNYHGTLVLILVPYVCICCGIATYCCRIANALHIHCTFLAAVVVRQVFLATGYVGLPSLLTNKKVSFLSLPMPIADCNAATARELSAGDHLLTSWPTKRLKIAHHKCFEGSTCVPVTSVCSSH